MCLFGPTAFLQPHPEDRDTHRNLGTERNEHEEDANSSEQEEKERPRNVLKY
jgi:hypothetical protein